MKATGIVRRIEAGFRKEQNNILNMRQKSILWGSQN